MVLSAETLCCSPNTDWFPVSTDISGSPQYCLMVLSAETLCCSPNTDWFHVSTDISGSHQYCLTVLSAETLCCSPNTDWFPVSTDISGSPQYCLMVLSAETLCCSPNTDWFHVSTDISGSPPVLAGSCHPRHLWIKWEVGKGNENLVYLSPWDFKRSFTCHKILRHGTSGFTSNPKVRCAADFYHP
jgi:hypothetical protein